MCKSCKKTKEYVMELAIKYGKFENKDIYIYYFNNGWCYAIFEHIPEGHTNLEIAYDCNA